MKTIDAYIPVRDMYFTCPRVVEAFSDFECTLKVTTGSNMYLRFITPLGHIINGTMEGNKCNLLMRPYCCIPTFFPLPLYLPPFLPTYLPSSLLPFFLPSYLPRFLPSLLWVGVFLSIHIHSREHSMDLQSIVCFRRPWRSPA